jgi:pyrimidine deaminase RibD-like protein
MPRYEAYWLAGIELTGAARTLNLEPCVVCGETTPWVDTIWDHHCCSEECSDVLAEREADRLRWIV